MNSNQELRPDEIKALFVRAASAEAAPDARQMLRAAQRPAPATSWFWLLPVAIGAAAVAAIFLFSPWGGAPRITPLQPVASTAPEHNPQQPAAGLNSREATLRKAEEAAKRKDWATAEKLAEQAGDKEKAALYFNEANAQEFLTLCEDAVSEKKSDDVYTYCYEALQDATKTSTYQEASSLLTRARALHQDTTLAEVTLLLSRAEKDSKSSNAKTLGGGKARCNEAKSKLEQVTKFSGSSTKTTTLEAKAKTLLELFKSTKAKCDDADCRSKGGVCSASGACESNPRTTKEDAMANIKSTLATPDGCSLASASLESYKKKYGADADYYYYKGYCYTDNPDRACGYYKNFLKVASAADRRGGTARQYIARQDESKYPTCKLP